MIETTDRYGGNDPMTSVLVQITAPHLCAGLVLVNRRVVDAAPILGHMRGWTAGCVKAYVVRKGWRAVRVAS